MKDKHIEVNEFSDRVNEIMFVIGDNIINIVSAYALLVGLNSCLKSQL